MKILLSILGGALIVAPIVVTYIIVALLADWVLPWLQILSPFVPRYMSVLLVIFILIVLGRYRKRANNLIDKPLSAIPVLGTIYKLFNSMAASLEEFINKIKDSENDILFLPRIPGGYPEVCYLMSKIPVFIWDHETKSHRQYLSVNFAPIPGVKGNSPVMVPKEIIDSYIKNQKLVVNIDDVTQYYASLGSKIPEGFLKK